MEKWPPPADACDPNAALTQTTHCSKKISVSQLLSFRNLTILQIFCFFLPEYNKIMSKWLFVVRIKIRCVTLVYFMGINKKKMKTIDERIFDYFEV